MADERTSADLARTDAAFRDARPTLEAPPTRFYLNLTERCQLRCRHCITDAPQKTASGSARDMSLEVVEALRPHLAHAAYVGFTHAGEPLLAPALEPVLEILRAMRGDEPTVVHLLSNGLALTEERFSRLLALGVNSWSLSLDGMSAASNDSLRIGASAVQLLERLRKLVSLRAAHPGTRLGLAWTVTRSNLAEIPALLEYASQTGLDWVKLEEMYPLNSVAREEAAIPPEQQQEAIARARAMAERLGVRLLEHLADHAIWKCRLEADPAVARFSALDDFVNRMEINPCRLPFELVCVEPDGAIKPMSFHHPAVGNLLRDGLAACWNAPGFVKARTLVGATRPCGRGPATCGRDPGPAHW